MSLNRPSLKTLISARQADIEARFPGNGVYRPKSVMNVLARAMAGGEHGLYGYLDHVALQLLPDTSDDDVLLRQADAYGLTQISAQAATGTITVTGDIDAQLDVTDRWQSAAGVTYATAAAVTLTATTAVVTVVAESAGSAGNLATGATLTLINPVAGIESAATVSGDGLSGGAEIEAIDSLRSRLLERMRKPAQGGSDSDYVNWAQAAHPGVDQVWVTDEQGPGYVMVRFITTDAAGGPIPTGPIVDAVDAAIQAQRPITARVTVLAPVPVAQDYSIQLTPDTSGVRAAVAEALADLHRREAEPSGTLLLSHIKEAISTAAGETDHVLTSPTANVTYDLGEYPVLGVITWL